MSLLIYFSFTVYFLLHYYPEQCEGAYGTETTKRLQWKILRMDAELVKDVETKVKAVQYIKHMYHKQVVYQSGEINHSVRQKLKRMLIIYARHKEEETPKQVELLVELQTLGRDIDKMCQMVEEYERSNQKRSKWGEHVQWLLRSRQKLDKKEEARRLMLRNNMKKIKAGEQWTIRKNGHMEDGFDSD